MNEQEKKLAKISLLNLVKDHRQHCHPACGVVLFRIWQVAEAAGLTFDAKERALFS